MSRFGEGNNLKMNKVSIGDLVANNEIELQTGPFGTQLKASYYSDHGTPVINVRNIGYRILNPEKFEFIPEDVKSRLSRHLLIPGDIVFGRKGAVDRHLLVTNSHNDWLQGSDCIRMRILSEKIIPDFISYSFLQESHKNWMLTQCGNKATMASLNQDVIKRIQIYLPDILTQKVIVDILAKYDDLIENNRRRIQLLEEAARLLYQEWFIRLRFPGHEHTKIVDGVPEGWKYLEIQDIADVNQSSLKSNYQGVIEYVDISSVKSGIILETTQYEFIDAPSRARRIIQHGDVIWSCVRPNLKSYTMIWNPPENMIVSTGFAVITPRLVPSSYLYFSVTTNEFISYLSNNAKGTSYPAVRGVDFETAKILYPSSSVVQIFDNIVKPLINQISILNEQSKKLHQARDILLPRLMNGVIPA